MSEDRFNRIENKVDRIDDKVDKVVVDVAEIKMEIKHHVESVNDHVTSDQRIIEHIKPMVPILDDLAEMVNDHKYAKEHKRRRSEKIKGLVLRISAITTILGLITAITKWKTIVKLFF